MKSVFIFLVLTGIGAAWYLVPPTSKHRMAPASVYYIRSYYPITTPRGITGWLPGQQLQEKLDVPTVAGCIQVSDGTYIAPLPLAMLTQDLDEADALQQGERTADTQTQASIAATAANISAYQQGVNVATASDISRAGSTNGMSSGTAASFNGTRMVGGAGGVYYEGSTTYVAVPAVPGTTAATSTRGSVVSSAGSVVQRNTATEHVGSHFAPPSASPSSMHTY